MSLHVERDDLSLGVLLPGSDAETAPYAMVLGDILEGLTKDLFVAFAISQGGFGVDWDVVFVSVQG
jgi:hypothetical protein